MELGTLRLLRRALSAALAIIGIAWLMLKLQAPGGPGGPGSGLPLALLLGLTFTALVVVWRKELAANEAAFAERERAQLAMLRLQVELAKKKREQTGDAAPKP